MPAVATSGKTLWSRSRDDICTRALRITGEIGTGETINATRLTEVAGALNDLCKELQTDGMPLWKIKEYTGFSYTATQNYIIGIGSTVNQTAPLKILYAFNHNSSVTPALDTPMLIVPRYDYELLGIKLATGRPNQLMYAPPGANIITVSDMAGTITVFPEPDAYSIANVTCVIIGHVPFDDYAAAGDVPDFPSYWFNALIWNLAADICYESGTPYAERSMIQKKADEHRAAALSFGTEEGSLFLQPRSQWDSPGGNH